MRRLIESNIEEVNRLVRIVENLFTLSRADVKELAVTLREVHLVEIVERARLRAETLAAPKSIRVVCAVRNGCTVLGDAEMLTQALMNLVENAVKYSHAGGTITLGLTRHGDEAELSVADEGIGVAERHKEKIFERFYRTDDARSRDEGGAGLGLAITHKIVAAHYGTIRVESTPGKGSTFVVALPCAEIE